MDFNNYFGTSGGIKTIFIHFKLQFIIPNNVGCSDQNFVTLISLRNIIHLIYVPEGNS